MDRPMKSASRGTTFLDLLLVFAMDPIGKIKGNKPRELIIMWGLHMRAHLIAAFSNLGSGVFVGGGVGRGIHDDAVEKGVVL
jgi:hypothetical protein